MKTNKKNVYYMRIITIVICSLNILCSCGTLSRIHLEMTAVDLSSNEKTHIDSSIVNHLRPTGDNSMYYKDSVISFAWHITYQGLKLKLTNLSDKTLQVLWDEGSFMGPNGAAGRIIHSGVKFIHSDLQQVPTVVPKESFISEFVVPYDNRYYYTNYFLITRDNVKHALNEYLGKQTTILLPIMIGDERVEYLFKFIVSDVKKYYL